MTTSNFVIIVMTLTFLSLLAACGPRYSKADNKVEMEQAQPLLTAIDQYWKTQGNFPASIEELVPDYLTELPETSAGESFKYYNTSNSNSGDNFALCFNDDMPESGYGCCFLHRFELWDCTMGIDH